MKNSKNLLTVLVLGILTLVIPVQARSIKAYDLITLDKVQLDEQLTGFVAKSGTGRIDYIKNTISLIVPLRVYCRPGDRCPRYMPPPLRVTLPIHRRYANFCQAMVYVAENSRIEQQDGNYEELELIDNSSNRCQYFVAIPQIELTYKTEFYDEVEQRTIKTRSVMSGKKD